MTGEQVTELLGVLGRIADAAETMSKFERKHYDLYQRSQAEANKRYALAEKRYREEKRLQAEAIRRSERIAAQLERADDRQAFRHDLMKTTLGLTVPDYLPKEPA